MIVIFRSWSLRLLRIKYTNVLLHARNKRNKSCLCHNWLNNSTIEWSIIYFRTINNYWTELAAMLKVENHSWERERTIDKFDKNHENHFSFIPFIPASHDRIIQPYRLETNEWCVVINSPSFSIRNVDEEEVFRDIHYRLLRRSSYTS